MTGGPQPQASRPSMPDGYGVPDTDEGLLDWSWAVTRLESALNYWFSTTRPRPPSARDACLGGLARRDPLLRR